MGGSVPPYLRTLYAHLPLLAGMFFVSVAALSGLLIGEYSSGLPDFVKIQPLVSRTKKLVTYILSMSLIIVSSIIISVLSIEGIAFQLESQRTLTSVLIVYTATPTLALMPIVLTWPGVYQVIEAIFISTIGGFTALLAILIGAITSTINVISRGIYTFSSHLGL